MHGRSSTMRDRTTRMRNAPGVTLRYHAMLIPPRLVEPATAVPVDKDRARLERQNQPSDPRLLREAALDLDPYGPKNSTRLGH
jgi:hypothetical protein